MQEMEEEVREWTVATRARTRVEGGGEGVKDRDVMTRRVGIGVLLNNYNLKFAETFGKFIIENFNYRRLRNLAV
jgi:hypothetical protein